MEKSLTTLVKNLALPGAFRVSDVRSMGLLFPSFEGRRRVEGRPGRQAQPVIGGRVCVSLSRRETIRPRVGRDSYNLVWRSHPGIQEMRLRTG